MQCPPLLRPTRMAVLKSSVEIRPAALLLVCVLGCQSAGIETLPPRSPFPTASDLEHGVGSGDVTSEAAVIWTRTVGPGKVRIEWSEATASGSSSATRFTEVQTREADDFTAVVPITGLKPDTAYRYEVRAVESGLGSSGRFRTAPTPKQQGRVRFAWSADLGGQAHCRQGDAGYPILDRILESQPSFAVLLGDLIYADDRCVSPPNAPGADFVATTLDEFRAKHRYQRGAAALRRLLAAIPVYVTWDDHEVRNNFSGPSEPLMPIGRRALFEYWPIRRAPSEPERLYRNVQWGHSLELFVLDTRQYRDPNGKLDSPDKTMLGAAQRTWLLDGLTRSTAVWKVIATSVPLSLAKAGTLKLPGNDSWARGGDGTGFQTELSGIVQTLLDRRIRNVIWLAADVHYAKVHQYDPDHDGAPDFAELICGPLAAASGKPAEADPSLSPRTLFSASGFQSFGVVSADERTVTIEIRDETGAVRFSTTIQAR